MSPELGIEVRGKRRVDADGSEPELRDLVEPSAVGGCVDSEFAREMAGYGLTHVHARMEVPFTALCLDDQPITFRSGAPIEAPTFSTTGVQSPMSAASTCDSGSTSGAIASNLAQPDRASTSSKHHREPDCLGDSCRLLQPGMKGVCESLRPVAKPSVQLDDRSMARVRRPRKWIQPLA